MLDPRKSLSFLRFVIKPLLFVILGSTALDLAIGIYLADLGPDAHETLLHKTGEWALISLICTLAVSPLMKWLLWPQLTLVRRMCGLYSAFYASVHLWVYLQFFLGFEWSKLWEEIMERPYITVGFLAWLLMLPLAATSTNRAMRSLKASWKSLHRLMYPIVILGVWHFTWQVKLDLNEPAIYIVITAVLLGWRFLKWSKNKPFVTSRKNYSTSSK